MTAVAFSNIRRDNFRLGKVILTPQKVSVLPDRVRIEQGKRILRSKSFRPVQPQARTVDPARKLKEQEIKEGIKVQLGPATLKSLLSVEVPVTEKVLKTVIKREFDVATGKVVERKVEELVDVPKKDSAGNVVKITKNISLGVLQKSIGEQFKALESILLADQLKTAFGLELLGGVLAQVSSLDDLTKLDSKKAGIVNRAMIATGAAEEIDKDGTVEFNNLINGRFITKAWIDEGTNEGDFTNWVKTWLFRDEEGEKDFVAKGTGFLPDPDTGLMKAVIARKFVKMRTLKLRIDEGQVLDLEGGDRQMYPTLRAARTATGIRNPIRFNQNRGIIEFDDGSDEKAEVDEKTGDVILEPEFAAEMIKAGFLLSKTQLAELQFIDTVMDVVDRDRIDDIQGFLDTDDEQLIRNVSNAIDIDLTEVSDEILQKIVDTFDQIEAMEGIDI